MKTKSELLLKLSFLAGIIPLVGGWGIFLTWLLGRYLNASDFRCLEGWGFMWMIICFFVAIGGLFLLLIYVLINRKNLSREMLIVLTIILINIPSVFIVLTWQEHVDDMQFIKVTNNSGIERLKVEIINKNQLVKSTILDNTSFSVLYYSHYDDLQGHRHYRNDKDLFILISGLEFKKEIPFLELKYGACKQLIINKNLKITQQ